MISIITISLIVIITFVYVFYLINKTNKLNTMYAYQNNNINSNIEQEEINKETTLLEVQEEINNQINPRSDANIDEFNANMETLKTDTIYGSAVDIKDGVNTFVSNVANSKSSAQITVNLLPVKCFGASIPAAAIVIDFSWLAPYRDTILSLWRFFFWASYFWLLFKRLPDILHGAGLITDMANYGNMTDGAEAVSFTTTIDTNTGEVSSRETHSYTDTYGNKNTVTYKSKGG